MKTPIFIIMMGMILTSTNLWTVPVQAGGHDGNGGNLLSSTTDQAKAAMLLAQDLLTDPNIELNPVVHFVADFLQDEHRDGYYSFAYDVTPIFPEMRRLTDSSKARWTDAKQAHLFRTILFKAVRKKEIRFVESEECPAHDNAHPDASVSRMDLSGEICVNLKTLSRRAPSELLRESMALLLHEMLHLVGQNEEVAQRWQKDFSAYYNIRFGELNLQRYFQKTVGIGVSIFTSALLVKSIAERDPQDPRALAYFVGILQLFASSAYITDELAMKILFRTSNLQEVQDHRNLIFAILHNGHKALSHPKLNEAPTGPAMKGKELVKHVDRLLAAWNHYINNLQYFQSKEIATDRAPKQLVCIAGKYVSRLYLMSHTSKDILEFNPKQTLQKCSSASRELTWENLD